MKSSNRVRSRRLSCGVLWLALGCQQVLGEFEETAEPASTSAATGGTDGGPAGTGGSVTDACSPNDRTCDGAVLRQCVDGRWEETPCANEARCDATAGLCRTCGLGEARCLDTKTLQLCDAEQDRWVTQPPCDTGMTCDEARGACVACQPESGVCVSPTIVCRCKDDQSGFAPRTCLNGCTMMGDEDRCSGDLGMAGGPAGICDGI